MLDATAVDSESTLVTSPGDGACDFPKEFPAIGSMIARYRLLVPLAAGGMGVVYIAHDTELNQRVALKLIRSPSHVPADIARAWLEAMRRECVVLQRLHHPNVVEVQGAGFVGETLWVAMELLDGTTLRAWHRHGRHRFRDVLAVLLQVGVGLEAAHASSIVHGDVKPDNVVVGIDGVARVIDFGLAAASRRTACTSAGTPAYTAPERYEGAPADERSDQFAFCVTCWELLFGERPFQGSSMAAIVYQASRGVPSVPVGRTPVPIGLRRVLEQGMSPRVPSRWPSMHGLVAAMSRFL